MSVYIQTGFTGLAYDLNHPRIAYRRRGATNAVASTEASGFAALNAANVRVDSAWRPTALPANWSIIFNTPRRLSYVGIAAHDLGAQNADISIQTTSDAGSTWDTVAGLGNLTPADDSAILCLFEEETFDGYRVLINSADSEPTIASIAGGPVMEWPQKSVWTGTPITEGDRITFADNMSDTGLLVGRTVVSDGLEFQVQIDNLSEAFRTGDFAAFKAYANGEDALFFIATRSEDYPNEVAYAWSSSLVRMSRDRPNKQISGSVTLDLMGYRQDFG